MADDEPAGDSLPAPALRASHDDRDRVVEVLRTAAGDGRLTAEELDERVEAALTARTQSELTVLTVDLPAAGDAALPSKGAAQIDCHHSNVRREGRWVVPQRLAVKVKSGNVILDFTQAVISHPVLHLDVEVSHGNLVLTTMPGVTVDADEVSVRHGNVEVRTPPDAARYPARLHVAVTGSVRGGNLRARPPRRTFWQWLLRQPARYALTS